MGILDNIDQTIISAEQALIRDGARQVPPPADTDGHPTVRALFIPGLMGEPVVEQQLPVDSEGDCSDAVRALIKGPIQHIPVLDGIDFLCDENAGECAGLNLRATALLITMKRTFAEGRFPGKTPEDPEEALEEAALWATHMRLAGPVVIVGVESRRSVSLPESTIVHAQTLLGL
ncbi:hypothetical protein OOJ91_33695 [Micromonospora lupini]|uniref:hypothetical protein n=1 Tax=Micromonospora lupini TaxID=285679 RepID=UPI002250BDCB|nr:hypothetical protein [Micromonospora lupini]MCX5070801.1 hypothetical protein [Micromonospora lupini]